MVNETAVVVFDDERVVANAGVMLPALLAGRLGLEGLVEQCVDLGDRSGRGESGPQGDDAVLGDGAGRGLHR